MLLLFQVNLKMREITESELKVKQHPLESPSHQKVRLEPHRSHGTPTEREQGNWPPWSYFDASLQRLLLSMHQVSGLQSMPPGHIARIIGV